MIFQTHNWVFWLIVVVALLTYTLMFQTLLEKRHIDWASRVPRRLQLSSAGLVALPLLGLLGTIMGLLATFESLSLQLLDFHQMIAGGVGTALGTTQLGLLFAAPGLLLQHYLQRLAQRQALVENC